MKKYLLSIYMKSVNERVGRGKPRRTFQDKIGDVSERGQQYPKLTKMYQEIR